MFYMHKTWTDSNLTFRKCWQEGEVMGIHTHVNMGNRLIMLHVGELVNFFLCAHLIYKTGLEAGDYHGQMNSIDFEKWGSKKLTSNFPLQPVILDNSAYRCLQVDRPLSACIVKTGMIWLCRNGIVSDET